MYTILVIITSKWKIILLVFEKTSFERWEVYYVGCQGLWHKSATVWLLNYHFYSQPLRLRISPQVFSNKKKLWFDFLQKYWRVLFVAVPDIRHNYIFYLFFLSTKNHKVSSILPFRHSSAGSKHIGKPVLRTLSLVSFLDMALKNWKCWTSALQQSMTVSSMWLDSAIIIKDSTFGFNYKCKNIYLNTVLYSAYDCWLLVFLQSHKMSNISLRQSHKHWQYHIKLSLQL